MTGEVDNQPGGGEEVRVCSLIACSLLTQKEKSRWLFIFIVEQISLVMMYYLARWSGRWQLLWELHRRQIVATIYCRESMHRGRWAYRGRGIHKSTPGFSLDWVPWVCVLWYMWMCNEWGMRWGGEWVKRLMRDCWMHNGCECKCGGKKNKKRKKNEKERKEDPG